MTRTNKIEALERQPPIEGRHETGMTSAQLIAGGSSLIVILLWGLHLGYPVHHLQGVRWTLLGYVIPLYYFLIVLPLLGTAGITLIFKQNWTKWELLWCLLPLICLPGILFSADKIWSIRQWFSWTVRGIIPGGVIFLTANPKKFISMFLRFIYPIIVAACLLGLAEVYYNHNPLWDNILSSIPETNQPTNPFYRPLYSDYSLSMFQRPGGTQGNRIPYTSTVIGFFPLGLWLLRYKRKFYWAHLLNVAIIFSLLIMAQVRSVWIVMLATVLLVPVLGLQKDNRERAIIITTLLGCFGIVLVLPKTHYFLFHRSQTFHLTDASIRERLDVLQTAGVLKERWFSGVGFGQFPTACKAYYHGAMPWIGTPDNQYLRWAIENGIMSFGLLVTFLVGLVRAGWKKIRRMRDVQQADFYKSILVGWLSVAATFLFFDGFYWGACNMTFWSFLGLFAICLKSE